MMLNILDMLCS